jgi:hypothetical protein
MYVWMDKEEENDRRRLKRICNANAEYGFEGQRRDREEWRH